MSDNLLALTATSKPLRYEALPMLYSTSKFRMQSATLPSFLDAIGKRYSDLIEEINIRDTVKEFSNDRHLFGYDAKIAIELIKSMVPLRRVAWVWIHSDYRGALYKRYAQYPKTELQMDRVLQVKVSEYRI